MSEEQPVAVGVQALIHLRGHYALAIPKNSEHPSVIAMRASLIALDRLIEIFEENRRQPIRVQFNGSVRVDDFALTKDSDLPEDEQLFFRLGIEGVDVASIRIGHDMQGFWQFSDRFGDGFVIAVATDKAFDDSEFS